MAASSKHLLQQGAVLKALGGIVARSAMGKQGHGVSEVPGPIFHETVAPRDAGLVRDYIRNVGGSPSWYKGVVPAHMYPQWGFPIMGKPLADLPYPMPKIINAGVRLEMNAPIPAGEALQLEAQLTHLNETETRALIKNSLVTGTASAPRAIESTVTAFFPLRKKDGGGKKKKKEKPGIPVDARQIDSWRLSGRAGLDFALLTGDFNPVHWIPAVARMSGFRGAILHGYASMARLIESLNRQLLAGDPTRLAVVDVRFSAPIVLPGEVGVFLHGEDECYVGKAPGAPACLTGIYTLRK